MALSSEHILTLQQLSGIGTKTIFKVAELVTKPINTIEELCTFWKTLKGKKLEAIGVDDIIEANNSAKRIIEASARESIGLVGYYDDTFPNILRQTIMRRENLTLRCYFGTEVTCLLRIFQV